MHDAAPVGPFKSVGDLPCCFQYITHRKRAFCHPLLVGHPLDVFHGDEGSVLFFSDLIDLADKGVVQGSRGLGLSQESFSSRGVLLQFLRQELQSDFAIQCGVLGKEDLSHATLAELF